MSARYTKVIGYFAYLSPSEVVCTGPACVIAGSERAMKDYIEDLDPIRAKQATIRKTRFGEIMRGIQLGSAYAFDEESYCRFYPLARQEGLDVAPGDFATQKAKGMRFFTVQIAGL